MTAHRRRTTALVLTSALLAVCAGTAAHVALPEDPASGTASASVPGSASVRSGVSALSGEQPSGPTPAPPAGRTGSTCRTSVERSRVVAYCHNPYPEVDLVRLHTECVRWWDIDGDGRQVEVGPAQTVRISGRCWKEVAGVWVTHERIPDDPRRAATEPGTVH